MWNIYYRREIDLNSADTAAEEEEEDDDDQMKTNCRT